MAQDMEIAKTIKSKIKVQYPSLYKIYKTQQNKINLSFS